MLNKILSGICLFMLPVLGMAQGIQFENGSFKQALNKAKAENKLLFIDAYADWCAPCKKMAKTVFMEDEVGAYFNENLVALKVNVEKGEGPKIKKTYDIQGLPGYVFIDGDGEVVYRFGSYMPTEEFLAGTKAAVKYSKDLNSIGRLKERYAKNMNDENVTKLYLDKLCLQAESGNYTDVLEHYLEIQTTIPDSSKAMVMFLENHNKQIIFGGKADQIIQGNIKTKAWKKYVRKDVRETYLNLPKTMVGTTTEYAILKRDSVYLERAIKGAREAGYRSDDAQIKKSYTYFYLNTEQGEKYKALVHDDIVNYVNAIDKEQFRAYYLKWEKECAAGDPEALRSQPHAIRRSLEIYNMAAIYSKFVKTDAEKKEVLSWMDVAYYIRPNSAQNTSNYANIVYLLGDKNQAIELKEEAYKLGQKEGLKRLSAIKGELDLMKAGEEIYL